ncbi:hypothetical protein [Actinomadura meridiana]|uniref:hypothetical protein n=1 Tax=Actinomadura meridiana TaxID=559626 RepID=UPI0031EB287B
MTGTPGRSARTARPIASGFCIGVRMRVVPMGSRGRYSTWSCRKSLAPPRASAVIPATAAVIAAIAGAVRARLRDVEVLEDSTCSPAWRPGIQPVPHSVARLWLPVSLGPALR